MFSNTAKRWVSLILLFSLIFAVAACSSSTAPAPSADPGKASAPPAVSAASAATPAATPVSGSGKTITIMTFLKPDGQTPREDALRQVIKRYTEKTGVQVKYSIFPFQDLVSQLVLAVKAGNPPDIAYVLDRDLQSDIKGDALMPLDDFVKKDMTDADKKDFLLYDKMGMFDGKKYTFPISFIVDALYIRKDMLDKAGLQPPKTWDEFIKAAKAMNTQSVSGFMFHGSPIQPNQLDYMLPIIRNRGGDVIDPQSGKAVFDSQPGIDSYKLIKSLIFDHKVLPPTAATAKYDDVSQLFNSGRAAMMFEGSHRYAQIANAVKPENLILAKFPGVDASKPSPADVKAWTLGIPKNAKNPNEAWAFINHFMSTENELLYGKVSGEIPVRNSVLQNDFYKATTGDGARIHWLVDYINEGSALMYAPPTFPQLTDIASKAMQEILSSSNSDVGQILKNAAKQYNDLPK